MTGGGGPTCLGSALMIRFVSGHYITRGAAATPEPFVVYCEHAAGDRCCNTIVLCAEWPSGQFL